MLQIDTREHEKMPKMFEALDVPFSLVALPVGDYAYEGKDMIVERKSIDDFLGSYISGHLAEQLENMETNYNECYLFISGNYEAWLKNCHFNPTIPQHMKHFKVGSFPKMKLHLYHSFPSLKICEFANDKRLAEGVIELFTYEGNKRLGNIIRKAVSKEDILLSQIAVIPGVGLERAKKVIARYSPKELYSTTKEQLLEIDGIGTKFAEKIKEVFQ